MKKSKTQFIIYCSFLFTSLTVFSQGIYESYIIVTSNGNQQYYDLNANTANPDFDGNDLGDFNSSNSLVLNGYEQKIWEDGCSINWSKLYYKIEISSDNSGSFTEINGGYASALGGNNHKWEKTDANINLLSGLSSGNYKITVYGQANDCGGDFYDSNSSNNYVANFTFTAEYSSDATIN